MRLTNRIDPLDSHTGQRLARPVAAAATARGIRGEHGRASRLRTGTRLLATGFALVAVLTWTATASATEASKAQLDGLGASLRPASDVALASGALRTTV